MKPASKYIEEKMRDPEKAKRIEAMRKRIKDDLLQAFQKHCPDLFRK
jgi:hypothetical protein